MAFIDEDRPLTDPDRDEYDFDGVAERLVSSLKGLTNSEGMVLGIEGSWGSGKTSFLNLLRARLGKDNGVHVITLAPWLTGNTDSLVSSLATALGPVLQQKEEAAGTRDVENARSELQHGVELLRGYAAKTTRALAPVAKGIGVVWRPAADIGDGLSHAADALEGISIGKTETELKEEISSRIRASGSRFIVLIDDLDRLEPAQTVEVVRLVRSVADFPNLVYVLCYDRSVLAHALEKGLSVADGDLFLQKIVQLSFTLPLPEPFDLRASLRLRCLELYAEVNGVNATGTLLDDLLSAIDQEGSDLSTPREVKLVFNAIAFVYPSIKDEVHFPDLVRIQLLKTLHSKLHRWIEIYLGSRSVLFFGDAAINESSRKDMGNQLGDLLPHFDDVASPKSIWHLGTFIPGLSSDEDPAKRVFQQISGHDAKRDMAARRLASPAHHRYYFALSGPKATLSSIEVAELRSLAGEAEPGALVAKLSSYIKRARPWGQSWYEHSIQRLQNEQLDSWSSSELRGLIVAYAKSAGEAMQAYERVTSFVDISDVVNDFVTNCLWAIKRRDTLGLNEVLIDFYDKGDLAWLVGRFHRSQLRRHGLLGSEAADPEDRRLMSSDQLANVKSILLRRIGESDPTVLMKVPNFGMFIFGWRDLAGIESAKQFVAKISESDEGFLDLLLGLRGWAVSDRVYHPLQKGPVEVFFEWEGVLARLAALESGPAPLSEKLALVRKAIREANRHEDW